MAKARSASLTRLELKIMQVIWKQGASTVNGVQEQLKPSLAYTTVQTMMNILERKGRLRRELQGRAYLYHARLTEANALSHAIHDLVDRMFGGSSDALVMNLIKDRHIDAKTLDELTRRLKTEEGGS